MAARLGQPAAVDLIGDEDGRLARVASWLDASPAEAVGLVVLLTGACVATSMFVWTALGRPDLPEAAASDTTAHIEDGTPGGPGTPLPDGGASDVAGVGTATDRTVDDHDGGARAATTDLTGGGAPVGQVTVHVAGAVRRPGVVTLADGARVADAVAATGGLAPGADLARTNLARPLGDGEQILILREGEEAPLGSDGATTGTPGGPGDDGHGPGPVDLNTATAADLQTLPGIGPTLAERIVRHREAVGRFTAPGDLRDVSGIGEVRFQEIAPLVTVG